MSREEFDAAAKVYLDSGLKLDKAEEELRAMRKNHATVRREYAKAVFKYAKECGLDQALSISFSPEVIEREEREAAK